jgi:hypothetical protein
MQVDRRWLIAVVVVWIAGQPGECSADEEPEDSPRTASAASNPIAACTEGYEPCVRPHPARIALASAGLGSFAAGAFLTFIVGDRAYTGDPNYLLVGGGIATLLGALAGQLFSITGNEWAVDGGVGPPLFAIGMTPAGWAVDGEQVPPIPMVRVSPALQLDRAGSTLRLDVLVGVQAGQEQRTTTFLGEAETVGSHEVRLDIGPELAVALPYPLVQAPSAPRTGGVELRYAPRLRARRYDLVDFADSHQVTERLTLLPLNLGIRWHLSPRQRFELLVGPRWDFQTLSRDGEEVLPLGKGQANNFYGEIWYRIDVPLSRSDTGPLQVTGELALGYEQWKGDHQAIGLNSIVGYLGPLHVDWTVHLRQPGNPVAAHFKAGAILASGGGAWFELGLSRTPLSATGETR